MKTQSRTGKIARLPLAIREELNRRLSDGEAGLKILPWLNALPEVKAILEEDFEGLIINDRNLSDWRLGGFQDWLKRRRHVDSVREMAQWSVKLAKAGGGGIAEGASAILSGKILEVLEQLENFVADSMDPSGNPDDQKERVARMSEAIETLTLSVMRLRKGDQNAEQLKLMRERLDQTGEGLKLAKQKFQRDSCELFLKWSRDERAKNILAADESNDAKTEQLGKLIFQEDWQ